MEFKKTEIEGVFIIEPKVFNDARGYFFEVWKKKEFEEHVGKVDFIQDNESESSFGVLRGLHFQKGEFAQAKLVRVIKGRVLDVAVDLRKSSPTFGRHVMVELSEDNKRQFFIPRGFAHGFLVLSDIAEFCYKCDDFYHPNDEGGMAWNDPEIGIVWPELTGEYPGDADASGYTLEDGTPLNLSEKDQKWLGLRDTFSF
jgi:dTDP-4-dehydrorhamnose 3,5-epimerase